MTQLNLTFENFNKFYFEGEKVQVKLEVNVEKSANLNSIIANFVGLGMYVSNDGEQTNMTSKFFTKNPTEIYFDDVLPLYVSPSKEASAWPPGTQMIMFEYQLPLSLPTSIESSQGFIRYSIHVSAEIDGKLLKKTEHFTVVAKTDLNNDVSAHLPGVLWKPENQCFIQAIFCGSGPVRAFLHIAKRGYVPGECIYINAEVCNFHRFPIEWVKATLIQVLKFHNSKAFEQKRVVVEVTRGCILPSETQTWRSESMIVPAIPPSSYPPKRLINVKYRLLFQFKPSWQRKPIELKQKIIIGVVRLLECGQKNGQEQGQGEGEGIYSNEFFNDSNLEPCIFGPHSTEEEGQCNTFSPLYPMYIIL